MNIENLTFLAIIPARGGSKEIPNKNILDINGKPLLAYTIEASMRSKYVTKTIVSSDSKKILSIAKKYNCFTLKRPKNISDDNASSEPLILHAIESLENNSENFDFVILLQPTSPLRNNIDIDDAIEKMLLHKTDSIISVWVPEHSPYKFFKLNTDGYLQGVIDNESPFKRRQDLPTTYLPNGAIYIIKTSEFKKNRKLFTKFTIPFLMSAEKSLDIDNVSDVEKAKKHLKKNN